MKNPAHHLAEAIDVRGSKTSKAPTKNLDDQWVNRSEIQVSYLEQGSKSIFRQTLMSRRKYSFQQPPS
jgi:hypothetical protein